MIYSTLDCGCAITDHGRVLCPSCSSFTAPPCGSCKRLREQRDEAVRRLFALAHHTHSGARDEAIAFLEQAAPDRATDKRTNQGTTSRQLDGRRHGGEQGEPMKGGVRMAKTKTRRLEAVMRQLDAERLAAGTCRHCGGRVPCWSPFGDVAVGKRYPALRLPKKGDQE